MIIMIGSKLMDDKGNHYILDEALGSGGFGDVYKAHSESDGSVVAIKLFKNTFNSDDAYLSFQKETNQSKLIDSDNVIKYLFVHDGKLFSEYPPYIIMEYTDGGTLRQFLKDQNEVLLDIETLNNIFMQLACGMKAVSEHLVHRDIKPENILNFNGTFKITDFGLSKNAGDSTKTLTFKNYGTVYYIAPEAWNSDKNTIQMDIYSMGIVFYELATLSFPYTIPMKQDYDNFRKMHLYDTVINPSNKNPNLPPHIVSMIIKMLEKPTQKRFNNWDEIIKVLETKPLPQSDVSAFVNRAISNRNERELERQRQESKKREAETQRKDYINFVFSQYHNTITETISEFVDALNTQNPNGKKVTVNELPPSGPSEEFSTSIATTSNGSIHISGEILFKENFKRNVQTLFGDIRTINYIPQCKGKDILLWCQVEDMSGYGFNLLLTKNDSSMYGDWYILENKVSALSQERRNSPFGFTLNELPKEIGLINAFHIYDSKLYPYTQDMLLQYIADRV